MNRTTNPDWKATAPSKHWARLEPGLLAIAPRPKGTRVVLPTRARDLGALPDELAHAELSANIHAWLAAATGGKHQLEPPAEVACLELLAEQAETSPGVTARTPAPATARALIRALAA